MWPILLKQLTRISMIFCSFIGAKSCSDFSLRFSIRNSDFNKCVWDGSVVSELHDFWSEFNAKFLGQVFYLVGVWFRSKGWGHSLQTWLCGHKSLKLTFRIITLVLSSFILCVSLRINCCQLLIHCCLKLCKMPLFFQDRWVWRSDGLSRSYHIRCSW